LEVSLIIQPLYTLFVKIARTKKVSVFNELAKSLILLENLVLALFVIIVYNGCMIRRETDAS
jgi:hypothetical protein